MAPMCQRCVGHPQQRRRGSQVRSPSGERIGVVRHNANAPKRIRASPSARRSASRSVTARRSVLRRRPFSTPVRPLVEGDLDGGRAELGARVGGELAQVRAKCRHRRSLAPVVGPRRGGRSRQALRARRGRWGCAAAPGPGRPMPRPRCDTRRPASTSPMRTGASPGARNPQAARRTRPRPRMREGAECPSMPVLRLRDHLHQANRAARRGGDSSRRLAARDRSRGPGLR